MEIGTLPEVIETARLRLRPWELTDVDDVLSYAQDPEWSRFLRLLPRPYTRRSAEEFVARQFLLDRGTHPAWAVVIEDVVVGGVNLRLRPEHRHGEIGYSLARERWNRGYTTEAVSAVVDAAFSALPDLVRLHARADVENAASQRVMEKVGMVKEGVLRQSRVERDEVVDEVWFAILREEWSRGSGGAP